MGLCSSSHQDDGGRARSREVDKKMQDANQREASINKLLLLGAGESGKSTLFKQMTEIYGKGFSEEERSGFVPIIHQNIIDSAKVLASKVEMFGDGKKVAATDCLDRILSIPREEEITPELAAQIITLWKDPAIQACYENRAKFQLTDSASYFFDRLMAPGDTRNVEGGLIGSPDFLPTTQDVLRSRVRTTGIVKKEFNIEGNEFELYDVGGQRNERKKWIHCFDNVTAVLFVGVLSEYNQTLYEDDSTNRMEETVKLFDEVVNATYFSSTDFILFLNKRDLFATKIEHHKLTDCPLFEGYPESINNYKEGCEAIQSVFLAKAPTKNIYPHITCATDTNLCKELLSKVTMIIIQGSLQDAGLV